MFRTLTNGQVILLYNTSTSDLIKPIGISGRSRSCGIQIFIHPNLVKYRIAVCIISPIVVIAEAIVVGVHTVVDVSLPHYLTKLLCIQYTHFVRVHARGYAGVEVNFYFPLFTALGGDDDYAIGSATTIDGSRCSIFQYLDALNVVSVQFVHSGFGRNAIDDVQRIVVVERTNTANTNGSIACWRTICTDGHARNFALEGFHRVVFVLFLQVIYAHHAYCARQVGFALTRITRHYKLIQ